MNLPSTDVAYGVLVGVGLTMIACLSAAGQRPVVPASATPGGQGPASRPAPKLPDGATMHRDLAYVLNGHANQKLDLYLPRETGRPVPVIIWIHGGAWRMGNRSQCPALFLLEQGYAVASVGYRFSQHAVFPAQIHDCKAAVRWLRAHAKQYNLDASRFGVWGSSAGGHLAALLGTSGNAKELEGDVGGNLEQSSRVQAVCDWFGPTDFLRMDDVRGQFPHNAPDSPESQLIGGPIQQNRDKAALANPIAYVDPADPPALIMHGDRDDTVPPNQSQLLYDALRKAGVQVGYTPILGAGHGGAGFDALQVRQQVQAFFDQYLKAPTTQPSTMPATSSRGRLDR